MKKDSIEKYIEESLSEEERDDFFHKLNHDSELIDELQVNLYMDDLLEQASNPERSEGAFLKKLTKAIEEQNQDSAPKKISSKKFKKVKSSRRKRRSKSPVPFLTITTIAACLVTCFTLLVISNSSSKGSNVAKHNSNLYIQDIEGEVFVTRNNKKSQLKDGDYIFEDDFISTGNSGKASLRYLSENSTAKIKPNSALSIMTNTDKSELDKVLFVKRGRVSFDIAKQKHGSFFRIKTGNSISTIVGTRLEVINEEKASTVKVFEGLVRVKSLISRHTVDVPANHYVVIKDAEFPNVKSIRIKKPEIIGFTLIDAIENIEFKGYESLQNGTILHKTKIPKSISIRINVSNYEKSGKVITRLKNSRGEIIFNMVEFIIPYTMTGDKNEGDYNDWTPPKGDYILETEVYDFSDTKTDTSVLTFSVK